MKSLIPAGRYAAQYVRRRKIGQDDRGGVEFTFRVSHGEYAGELVSMRLWASGRIERADRLRQGEAVEIVVSHREAASGQRFATVHYFRRLAACTAADAVRGEDEASHRRSPDGSQNTSDNFLPHPLLTECEAEEALWSANGETDQPLPFPLLDDDTADSVMAAAQSSGGQPMGVIEDAPDFSEADEDMGAHGWIVTRHGCDTPECTLVANEENPPPLAVALEKAKAPVKTSLFRYTDDLRSYMAAHGQSVRGYSGLAWASWLSVRLLTDEGLERIHERACYIAVTCARLGVPRGQIIAVNSWNCGLTVLIPSCAANTVPQVGYEKVAGHFVQALADLACVHAGEVPMREILGGLMLPRDPRRHARIDRQLYGPVAVHPAINSPDESGKRFAVALSYEELTGLPVEDLKKLAKTPRAVPRPTWRANEVKEFVSLWEYAVKAEQLRANRFAWLTPDDPFVHADTFDWLHHGSDLESAPKRLFRAAINLLRLGCSQDAVVALLHPAAHLSGLSREDVTWGVQCAAKTLVPEGFYLDDDE